MTTATDLHYLALHELAEQIRTKQVSPVDATRATLERIERLNPKLNAYITVTAEQAMADARAAEQEIASGTYRGPLHGVPLGLKDLCETKGVLTTAGAKFLRDNVPSEDAPVVQKLRAVGAVIVGKLNMHEWALGTTGLNLHAGDCKNPWNVEYITGGSSSGSGSAVAAGLCYAATGSDTGGSIRVPAALCGIAGIKPTYGRVSKRGVVPLSQSLDHVGPMARTTRDCALVLQAIAGHDPQDEWSVDAPVDDYLSTIDGGLKSVRVGVAFHLSGEADPVVLVSFERAVKQLESLGATAKSVDTAIFDIYFAMGAVILLSEAAAFHKERLAEHAEDFGDDVRMRLQTGADSKVVDYIRAMELMREARHTSDERFLGDVDLLVMPSTILPAPRADSVTLNDPTVGLGRLTLPTDFTGQPAMSVPCGFTDDGRPIGLMIVGKHFDEALVLRAAHAFEQASGLSERHPPVD